MNERLEAVAKVLMSYDLSSENPNREVKSLADYRSQAATVLVISDNIMFSQENMFKAIEAAGYDIDTQLETLRAVTEELRKSKGSETHTLADMRKAWAKGHENGFFAARSTDVKPPAEIFTPDRNSFFTASDVRFAEAAGYYSGFYNGLLSKGSSVPEGVLLGAAHGEANNPYKEEQ